MHKRNWIFLVFINVFIGLTAQDTLLSLGINPIQVQFQKESQSQILPKASLDLPFVDDFAQNWSYPKRSRWEDDFVFINSNYPIKPVSYGVATFDGLDRDGLPYNFADPSSYGIADLLTSQPIDLSTVTDSVYLSFYYQPQGLGNVPEGKDSLRVEFFDPVTLVWNRVWGMKGSASHPFKLVMLPVENKYHVSDFKFRFMNLATLSGNVDHWHVDYVMIDDQRTYDDTVLYDVALVTDYHSMLKDYTAMPWLHYMEDSVDNMKQNMEVTYRNNSGDVFAVFYKYKVFDENKTLLETYPTTVSSKNVSAYSDLVEPQAVNNLPVNDFYYPTDYSVRNKVFEIQNYFDLNTLKDSNQINDTVYSYQEFGNYYSYDDGSAEAGYGVQGIGAKLAHKFEIKKMDTLTNIRMYFNPILHNKTAASFKLTVWSSLSPETIVFQESGYSSPQYSEINAFVEYPLESPLVLNKGTYYVGYQKITEDYLNIGWDFNINSNYNVSYTINGTWTQASFNGSLMLHPVFGSTPNASVEVNEYKEVNTFTVYPNPVTDVFTVKREGELSNEVFYVGLYDVEGRLFQEKWLARKASFDISYLDKGVYYLRVKGKTSKETSVKQIVKM